MTKLFIMNETIEWSQYLSEVCSESRHIGSQERYRKARRWNVIWKNLEDKETKKKKKKRRNYPRTNSKFGRYTRRKEGIEKKWEEKWNGNKEKETGSKWNEMKWNEIHAKEIKHMYNHSVLWFLWLKKTSIRRKVRGT